MDASFPLIRKGPVCGQVDQECTTYTFWESEESIKQNSRVLPREMKIILFSIQISFPILDD